MYEDGSLLPTPLTPGTFKGGWEGELPALLEAGCPAEVWADLGDAAEVCGLVSEEGAAFEASVEVLVESDETFIELSALEGLVASDWVFEEAEEVFEGTDGFDGLDTFEDLTFKLSWLFGVGFRCCSLDDFAFGRIKFVKGVCFGCCEEGFFDWAEGRSESGVPAVWVWDIALGRRENGAGWSGFDETPLLVELPSFDLLTPESDDLNKFLFGISVNFWVCADEVGSFEAGAETGRVNGNLVFSGKFCSSFFMWSSITSLLLRFFKASLTIFAFVLLLLLNVVIIFPFTMNPFFFLSSSGRSIVIFGCSLCFNWSIGQLWGTIFGICAIKTAESSHTLVE